ncbi:MAG TPA: ATP-grasp domain-containing protein, partial [Acidimicrobiales bacterium]|nr:ATP-grasp domain-containing protein [Acidimicrobiales bacterium]
MRGRQEPAPPPHPGPLPDGARATASLLHEGTSCSKGDAAPSHDVLILGVSARAAASSAIRCGLRPYCVDDFADRDLAAACPVERADPARGVERFADVADALAPSPWFYTGGLENHPDLVDRIARRHRLWGVGGEGLRRVRDPVAVAEALGAAGIPAPEVRLDPRGLPRDGTWMVKPMASGGGIGVAPWMGQEIPARSANSYQQRIDGSPFAALFIGAAGRARLVGVVRQWVGGVPGRPFAYRGGIGPWRVGRELAMRLCELGDRLVHAFGLVGWFGVDYVLRDDVPWPVEVNPRYTASVEIHELATGRPLLPEHRAACEGIMDPESDREARHPRPSRVVAKWIMYAPRRLVIPESAWEDIGGAGPEAIPPLADIPAPGVV